MLLGAVLGLIAGICFERSSLVYYITGFPNRMLLPGEKVHYEGPLIGMFAVVTGMLGALLGAVIGTLLHYVRPNHDEDSAPPA